MSYNQDQVIWVIEYNKEKTQNSLYFAFQNTYFGLFLAFLKNFKIR